MDTDIDTAATPLALDKLKAQEYRDALKDEKAHRTAMRQIAQEQAALNIDTGQAITADTMPEFKREVILALIPKYMTTSTNTTPAGAASDAVADCMRLKAALDEILKL